MTTKHPPTTPKDRADQIKAALQREADRNRTARDTLQNRGKK